MKCIVCDKPVAGSSNVCSTSCLLAAGPPGGGKKGGKGRSVAGLVHDVFAASLEGRPDSRKDVPMIIVKHRWMKNRNQRFGNTNLSFNGEGLARVADVGNARLDVEGYVRHSRGLAWILHEEQSQTAPVTVPEVSPPPVPAPKPKPPMVEVVKEPEPDFKLPTAEETVMGILEEMEPEEVVDVLLKGEEEEEEKPKVSKKKPPKKKSSSKKK